MKSWKLAIIISCLSLAIPTNTSRADFSTCERVTSYELQFQNINWIERLIAKILGYEFLNWKEIQVKELVVQEIPKNNSEVVLLSVLATGFREIAYLKCASAVSQGFMHFKERVEYTPDNVNTLLTVYNHLYKAEEGATQFIAPNLFEDESEPVCFRVAKQKSEQKYLIHITVLKREQGKLKEMAIIEAVMNPLPQVFFEMIVVELKESPKVKFVLTKKP